MIITPLGHFMYGAIMMSNVLIGLFFFRFYRKTKDKLLFFFGIAFLLMAFERIILVFVEPSYETHGSIYLIRLVAFLLIIFAIVNKNRKSGSPS